MAYESRVKGHLSPDWSEWIEGMTITPLSNGETALSGPVRDQAALFGVLIKIRDLELTLVSVSQVESGEPPTH